MIRPRKLKRLIIILAAIVAIATATGWDAVVNQPVVDRFKKPESDGRCYHDVVADC
jgi:hypothetical protein